MFRWVRVHPRHRLVLLAVTLLGVAACQQAAQPPVAPSKAPPGPPGYMAPAPQPYGQPYPAQTAPGQPTPLSVPPPPPPLPPPLRSGGFADVEREEAQLASQARFVDSVLGGEGLSTLRCEHACAALASMRRSVVAICELAGAATERCERARATLGASEARVEQAGCGCAR